MRVMRPQRPPVFQIAENTPVVGVAEQFPICRLLANLMHTHGAWLKRYLRRKNSSAQHKLLIELGCEKLLSTLQPKKPGFSYQVLTFTLQRHTHRQPVHVT
jgi:hypothetical protein